MYVVIVERTQDILSSLAVFFFLLQPNDNFYVPFSLFWISGQKQCLQKLTVLASLNLFEINACIL